MAKKKKSRTTIYVDASKREDECFYISIYIKTSQTNKTLKLPDTITKSYHAETFGVLFAFLHIIQLDIRNSIILCDNEATTTNPTLLKLINNSSKITWIPREINTMADKLSRIQPPSCNKDLNTILWIAKHHNLCD